MFSFFFHPTKHFFLIEEDSFPTCVFYVLEIHIKLVFIFHPRKAEVILSLGFAFRSHNLFGKLQRERKLPFMYSKLPTI